MKLRIISDLHLEFYAGGEFEVLAPSKTTILVLAGDIHAWAFSRQYENFIKQCSDGFRHVILVPGNHEFYGSDFHQATRGMDKMCKKFDNVCFLDDDYALIDDVMFFGSTLWTDMHKGNPLAAISVQNGLNDFTQIRVGKHVLTPELWMNMHKDSCEFLMSTLATFKNSKRVVVSHHLPSYESIPPKFRFSSLNDGYASDLTQIIRDLRPELWIHGHTHDTIDYNIGDTRVVCNPRGYPHEPNYHFDPYFEVII